LIKFYFFCRYKRNCPTEKKLLFAIVFLAETLKSATNAVRVISKNEGSVILFGIYITPKK